MADYRDVVNNTFTDGIIKMNEAQPAGQLDALSTGLQQLKQTMINNYEPNKMKSQNEFNAICLLQLDNVLSEDKELIRVKARIPEVHSLLPIPKNENDFHTISLYPTFIGVVSDLAVADTAQAITIGTEIAVTFDNTTNFGGPKIVRISKMSPQTEENGGPDKKNKKSRHKLKQKKGPKWPDGGKLPGAAVLKRDGAIWHKDTKKGESAANTKKYEAVMEGKDNSLIIVNNIKMDDGKYFKHGKAGDKNGNMKLYKPSESSWIKIHPDVADDYVALVKDIYNNKIDGLFGSSGAFSRPLYEMATYHAKTWFSYHLLARGFDIFTRLAMWPISKETGKSQNGMADPYGKKTWPQPFLVTISTDSNQDKTKLDTYAGNFFIPTGGIVKGQYYTVWMKTKNKTAANKVKLQVATPKKQGSGYIFNKDTFTEWDGHAINFTALAAKHNFHPIRPIRSWGKLSGTENILKGNSNYNEWHHFQNFNKLEKGISLFKEELWRIGYSESYLRAGWPENYEFYGEAPWPGPGGGWHIQSEKNLYTSETPST
jgi:hypothetical protein